MVWRGANRPQWYTRILKEATIEALRLRILEILELTVKGAEAKLRILVEEDV